MRVFGMWSVVFGTRGDAREKVKLKHGTAVVSADVNYFEWQLASADAVPYNDVFGPVVDVIGNALWCMVW